MKLSPQWIQKGGLIKFNNFMGNTTNKKTFKKEELP